MSHDIERVTSRVGGIELLLADHWPLNADIPVGRAIVLGAQAEPAGGADRRGLARSAAGQHGQHLLFSWGDQCSSAAPERTAVWAWSGSS